MAISRSEENNCFYNNALRKHTGLLDFNHNHSLLLQLQHSRSNIKSKILLKLNWLSQTVITSCIYFFVSNNNLWNNLLRDIAKEHLDNVFKPMLLNHFRQHIDG